METVDATGAAGVAENHAPAEPRPTPSAASETFPFRTTGPASSPENNGCCDPLMRMPQCGHRSPENFSQQTGHFMFLTPFFVSV